MNQRDRPNNLMLASGSLKEARRLIMQYLQESKPTITSETLPNFLELGHVVEKIETLRIVLEVKSHNAG